MVNLTLLPLFPKGKFPQYTTNRGLFGVGILEKNSERLPGIEPQQPVI
jgi:hypothetical protein